MRPGAACRRGDPYYVGLAGLEFFDIHGLPIKFENPQSQARFQCTFEPFCAHRVSTFLFDPGSLQIWADPADINVLPEYSCDPRVVSNLLDGKCATF